MNTDLALNKGGMLYGDGELFLFLEHGNNLTARQYSGFLFSGAIKFVLTIPFAEKNNC